MKELKEKSFTVYVTLNDDSNVQTMLENLYNEGTLRYDDIHLDGTDVVSDGYYKGLKYGSIDDEALLRKTAIEDKDTSWNTSLRLQKNSRIRLSIALAPAQMISVFGKRSATH